MSARIFTAVLPDGSQCLVTIWPDEADGGEVAFRDAPEPSIRWGIPTQLVEETS